MLICVLSGQIWVYFPKSHWSSELDVTEGITEPYFRTAPVAPLSTQNHRSDVTFFKLLIMTLHAYTSFSLKVSIYTYIVNLLDWNPCKNTSLLRFTFLVEFLSGKKNLSLVLILKYYLVNFQRPIKLVKYKNFSIPR